MNKIVIAEKKIAMITENGFNEAEFITLQKAFMTKHAQSKIISSRHGLVSSNPNTGKGISYAVDYALSETLAIDYDCLIVVGGAEHIESLSEEPHAIRLTRAFLRENMPILFVSDGSKLLDVIGDTRFHGVSYNEEIIAKSGSVFWSINGQSLSIIFTEFFEKVCSGEMNKKSPNGVAA